MLLLRLNIVTPSELLDKAFGLSLSDQYWLKPVGTDIKYEDINFFDNDFNYAEFMEASLSKNSKMIQNASSLKTPNNASRPLPNPCLLLLFIIIYPPKILFFLLLKFSCKPYHFFLKFLQPNLNKPLRL